MINIKSYAKAKQNTGGTGTGSGGYGFASLSVINQQVVNSSADDWFYFNDQELAVHCRYTLVGNYDIAAWSLNDSSDYGPGGGCSCEIIDNLLSDSSTSCLSARLGKILSEMIANIELSGGGGDGHVHSNLDILNSLDLTDLNHWDLAYDKAHDHENLSLLNSLSQSLLNLWTNAANNAHSHQNKVVIDKLKQIDLDNYNDASNLRHSHPNKNVIDLIDQESLDSFLDAADQAHTHNNYSVLQNITSTKVSHWDLAYNRSHSHGNKSILDGITNSSILGWDHVNDWFYQDSSGNVHSRVTFISDDELIAFNYGDGGSGSGSGSLTSISIIDNLLSSSTNAALSANQGRILKGMIDNGLADVQDLIDNLVISGETSHTHANLLTLNLLTARTFLNFVDASNLKHEHTNKSLLDSLTSTLVNLWNGYLDLIDDLGDEIGEVSTRLKSVSTNLNSKITNVSTKLNSVSTNLSNVSSNLSSLYTTVENISTRLVYAENNIDDLIDSIADVSTDLNSKISSVSTNLNIKIEEVSTRLKNVSTNLNNKITNVSTRLATTNTSVNILESSVLGLSWLNDAFYMTDGKVHSKYSFIGDYEILAYSTGDDSGSGGGGEGYLAVIVLDRLDSTSTGAALSANQGRILDNKITNSIADILDQIDNLVISGETSHSHANLLTLNLLTAQTFLNFVDSSNLKHSHSNGSVLAGITSTKVNKWDGYQTQISTLNGDFSDLNERVMTAETNISNVSTRLSDLSTYTENVSTRLKTLNTTVSNHTTNINTINTRITNLSTKISNVSSNLADSNSSIGQLWFDVSQLKADVELLQDIVYDMTWMNDIFGLTYDSSGNRILRIYGGILADREITAWNN